MIQYLLLLANEEQKDKINEFYCNNITAMVIYSRQQLDKANDKNSFHDGLDAVQNAFVKIIKYGKVDFSRSEQEVKGYFYAVIDNEIINIINDIKKIRKLDEEYGHIAVTDEEFFSEICIKERYETVKRAIALLDERYSSVLIMSINDTPEKIAKILGLPVKTVYTRISRGRKFLIEKVKFLEKVGAYHG